MEHDLFGIMGKKNEIIPDFCVADYVYSDPNKKIGLASNKIG